MMATEQKSLDQFIAEHRITSEARRADSNPNTDADAWSAEARHFLVTLKRGDASMAVPFSQGSAWTTDPSTADVLDSLASDASDIENASGFEDWCAEYGYDTDSRRAERLYHVCRLQAADLHDFLGEEAYEVLLWSVERQ